MVVLWLVRCYDQDEVRVIRTSYEAGQDHN